MATSAAASRFAELLARAPVYAILDTSLCPDLAPAADALLRAGVRVLQYRHKQAFGRAQFEQCLELASRVRQSGGLLLINDRADVAALCGADGVHLGQDDLPPRKARALLGAGRLIGYSTHSVAQAALAAGEPADYIAVGPVFATTTKENPGPAIGLQAVSDARERAAKPLVAIGGISVESAPAIIAAGANAVAVARNLIVAPDVEQRAREFLSALAAK